MSRITIYSDPDSGMSRARLRNLNAVPQTVKSQAGNFYGVQVENTQVPAADAWIQVFDKLNPNPGTDSPDKEFKCPPGSTRYTFQPQGSQFKNAISVLSTTTEAGGQGSNAGVHVFIDFA